MRGSRTGSSVAVLTRAKPTGGAELRRGLGRRVVKGEGGGGQVAGEVAVTQGGVAEGRGRREKGRRRCYRRRRRRPRRMQVLPLSLSSRMWER